MSAWRRRGGNLTLRLITPLLIYLAFGRWLGRHTRIAFRRAFHDRSILLPPLWRAMVGMPAGRQILRHAALYLWHHERDSLDPAGPPDLGGDLFTAWTGPPVSFLHLEKCGGTALMRWFSRQFHPAQIERDPWRDLPPNFYYRAPPGLANLAPNFPLIWGHYDVPSLARLAPGRFTFTLLREPRTRLLSLYNFWRSVDPGQVDLETSFSVALAHRLCLVDFLGCDEPMQVDLIDNFYTRRLTGLYATGAATDPVAKDPDAARRAAEQALARLDLVGITEHLDETARRLAALLGIAPPPPGLRGNVAAENHADPSGWFRSSASLELSPRAEAALARRTALDTALYARARTAFEAGQQQITSPA